MKICIQRKSHISLREQIKRQILALMRRFSSGILGHFLSRLSVFPAEIMDKQVLVMDCNQVGITDLSQKITAAFVTHFVFDRVKTLCSPVQKLVKVKIGVDASNISLIRKNFWHDGRFRHA